jgi:hypothetical protein
MVEKSVIPMFLLTKFENCVQFKMENVSEGPEHAWIKGEDIP